MDERKAHLYKEVRVMENIGVVNSEEDSGADTLDRNSAVAERPRFLFAKAVIMFEHIAILTVCLTEMYRGNRSLHDYSNAVLDNPHLALPSATLNVSGTLLFLSRRRPILGTFLLAVAGILFSACFGDPESPISDFLWSSLWVAPTCCLLTEEAYSYIIQQESFETAESIVENQLSRAAESSSTISGSANARLLGRLAALWPSLYFQLFIYVLLNVVSIHANRGLLPSPAWLISLAIYAILRRQGWARLPSLKSPIPQFLVLSLLKYEYVVDLLAGGLPPYGGPNPQLGDYGSLGVMFMLINEPNALQGKPLGLLKSSTENGAGLTSIGAQNAEGQI